MEALQWIKESEEKYPDSIGCSFFDPNHSRPLKADIEKLYKIGAVDVWYQIDFHKDEAGQLPSSGDTMYVQMPNNNYVKKQVLDQILSWKEADEINDQPVGEIEKDILAFTEGWFIHRPTVKVWFD